MTPTKKQTHLPQGARGDAHPAGGYIETGQPLNSEKVPSTQGGGVPASIVAVPSIKIQDTNLPRSAKHWLLRCGLETLGQAAAQVRHGVVPGFTADDHRALADLLANRELGDLLGWSDA